MDFNMYFRHHETACLCNFHYSIVSYLDNNCQIDRQTSKENATIFLRFCLHQYCSYANIDITVTF